MRHREPLKYITNESVCVEIGVWKGDFNID
jgi:hypothetical protein